MADNPTIAKELVTAQMFQKFVDKFSADTKMTRRHEKQKAEEARAEVKATNEELKELNKRIQAGEEIRSKEYEDAKERAAEIKEEQVRMGNEFGNFSEEATKLREDNKDELAKLDDIVAGQSDVLDADEMQGRRQDATERRDKAQELSDEEKKKDQGFASKKMVGLLSGIEKGIGGMWKKGKSAVGLTFKGALIATGLLLLLKFLESKKWQEIKDSIKKFAEGGGFDFIKTTMTSIYDYLFGKDSVFKRMGKVFDAFFGEDEYEGPAGQYKKEKGFIAGMQAIWNNFSGLELWVLAFAIAMIIPGPLGKLILVGNVLWWGAKGIWTAFTAMSGWVGGFAKKIFTGIGAFLKEKWATSPIKTAFKGLGDKFTSIVTKFKTILTGAIEGAGKWLAELAGKVRNSVPYKFISKSVPRVAMEMGRGLGRGWDAVKTAGAGLVKSGKDAAGTAAKKVMQWGPRALQRMAGMAAHAKTIKGVKSAAKVGKFLAKRIPGVSIVMGTGLAMMALSEGKYALAAGQMLSGLLATIPGPGTAASIALDAAMAASQLPKLDKIWAKGEWEEKVKSVTGGGRYNLATYGDGTRVGSMSELDRSQSGFNSPRQQYLRKVAKEKLDAEATRMAGTGISFEEFRNQNRGVKGMAPSNQLAMWQAELGKEGYKGVAPQAFIHGGDDNSQSFSVMPVGSAANPDKYLAHEWMSGP